jgi:ABC-type transport system involved in multi-copper enzyme maturation permease subunit
MKWLPVIARELRSEARQPFTYWMRLIAAALALGIAVLGSFDRWQGTWSGSEFFDIVQPTLFSLIWLFAPIMTCDSISRERREGTLGLLLLTLLRPMDVGLAKACSGILRSLSVVLAVLPMLAIALLLGGVSRNDLLRAGMMDAMALLGAIGAGLLASSRCRNFSRAAVLALVLAALALFVLGNIQSIFYISSHAGQASFDPEDYIMIMAIGPWALCAGITEIWRQGGTASATSYLWVSAVQVLLAALFLRSVLVHLDRNLRRLAFDAGRSARQEWWWRVYCTPVVFTGWLKRRQRWLLNRNPIGWLQRRTWSARLCTCGWMGVVVLVETALVSAPGASNLDGIRDAQLILAGFVAVGLAFSAADSFRVERETGALELLLVTPLRVRQIIAGRLFGVWGQYVLVFGLLTLVWWQSSGWMRPFLGWRSGLGDRLATVWLPMTGLLFSTFLLVPVIGLNQSMIRKHFVTSWIVTLTLGVIIPVFLPASLFYGVLFFWLQMGMGWGEPGWSTAILILIAVLLQAWFAAKALRRLERNLDQRQFALAEK